ncbi:MAG: peptidoglycan bridge formation glycyltransferase FemA/FemB family protein [Anaerolineae bacterium]|nr:peptidoglycan bridge formation glycyltransferase FemA/FemB family protein [Anaerolineae bacterium]MDW8172851.1 peptidoglycan bridge formation glycyltransferase FemA/FemB family protein [Anaerolineae bacterium]
MSSLRSNTIIAQAEWDALAQAMPSTHILQSWAWGDFKRAETGWQPLRLAFTESEQIVACASVGQRRLFGLSLLYAPKGPLLARLDLALLEGVLEQLEALARQRRALWLKIDPDIVLGRGVPNTDEDEPDAFGQAVCDLLHARGWHFSHEQIQFPNTLKTDLSLALDELLASFSQNTRRKIRTAEKRGVVVRPATPNDMPLLYDLYQQTGARDGFLTRPYSYYRHAWEGFMRAGLAQAFIAELEGQPLAHVVLYRYGATCWYFYGASSVLHRDAMPNYALQWTALQWAKSQGCTTYDWWGAPTVFHEDDRLWGVYEFKRGFRGQVVRHVGAWDYAPSSLLYRAYRDALPRLRRLIRR